MFGRPLARCLGPTQTEYVIKEVHEGHCGNHTGGRSLVKTLIRAGYYWPKMEEDAESFVAKCDRCQRYGNNMHRLAELLHIVIFPCPFIKWGMDIVGPFPRAKGKIGTGETPFSLVYSSEALILVEIGEPSMRFTQATEESNNEELRTNLNLLEQRREAPLIRMAAQKQTSERYYNRKAHLRYFKIGDFVLKKGFQSTKTAGAGKLNPNWEGPYKV
ncbi:uncharacterized protein LOC142171692 [Nicotiana tabacum]|uniref:Uncharacterized protein LOC142171692 n=1 Tax=Nicotiana tabacum TaxID=4097 RepID=A0AC58T2M3_TOBAC